MTRRNRRAVLDISHLDDAQKLALLSSDTPVPPNPVVVRGKDNLFSGPRYFDNLRRNPSYVDTHDEEHVHRYGQRGPRNYTRTGSFITDNDPTNVPVPSVLLADVPRVQPIDSMKQMEDDYRVFIDMASGEVLACIALTDLEGTPATDDAVVFYRRYFSLIPRPIEEKSGAEVKEMSKHVYNMLTCNGEPIKWATKTDMTAYLMDPNRRPALSVGKWDMVPNKKITFGKIKDGLPYYVDAGRMLSYNFRYGSFKVA